MGFKPLISGDVSKSARETIKKKILVFLHVNFEPLKKQAEDDYWARTTAGDNSFGPAFIRRDCFSVAAEIDPSNDNEITFEVRNENGFEYLSFRVSRDLGKLLDVILYTDKTADIYFVLDTVSRPSVV